MIKWIAGYLGAALAMGVLDAVWLTTMANRLYRPALGSVMRDKPDMGAAILFYLIYLGGILFFAVAPAMRDASLTRALVGGAVLGLVAYATYDLTNQATLSIWQTRLTVIDLAWGTFLTTVTAGAGFLAAQWAEGRFG